MDRVVYSCPGKTSRDLLAVSPCHPRLHAASSEHHRSHVDQPGVGPWEDCLLKRGSIRARVAGRTRIDHRKSIWRCSATTAARLKRSSGLTLQSLRGQSNPRSVEALAQDPHPVPLNSVC